MPPVFEQGALDSLVLAKQAIEYAISNYQKHFVDTTEALRFGCDAAEEISHFMQIVLK